MRLSDYRRTHHAAHVLLPLMLGIAAFVLVTGGAMVWPSNVAWLQDTDLAQSYLGWAFYRHDPWMLPFGANPSYGLELHSSVYYSDSVPLLAMALKPLSPLLPDPFQYFGLWVLLCFVLQAWFAWKLLALATPNFLVRALGCVFFILAPPLLMRLGGHMALFGQWAVLAAVYLYLRPEQRSQRTWWTVLVAVAMLIHAYIFLIVAAVWAADVLRRGIKQPRDMWKPLLLEVVQVLLVTAVVAWMAGLFMVPGSGQKADGFGFYKMNLLAPFNGAGWSWFGLHTPEADGEYEGFNYFGMGGLVLLGLGAIAWIRTRRDASRSTLLWPLVAAGVVLTALAVTNNVGIGATQFHISLPDFLQRKLSRSSIQSTGRLFWLPYYALLLGAIFVLARALPARIMIAVMAVVLAIQLTDLHPGLDNMRTLLLTRAQATDVPHLRGPFWTEAATRYTRVRMYPTRIMAPDWVRVAMYAEEHRMATDAVKVARVNWRTFGATGARQQALLMAGTPEDQTLYVLDPTSVAGVAAAAQPSDAVFDVDGLTVLAPSWGPHVPAGATVVKAGR